MIRSYKKVVESEIKKGQEYKKALELATAGDKKNNTLEFQQIVRSIARY